MASIRLVRTHSEASSASARAHLGIVGEIRYNVIVIVRWSMSECEGFHVPLNPSSIFTFCSSTNFKWLGNPVSSSEAVGEAGLAKNSRRRTDRKGLRQRSAVRFRVDMNGTVILTVVFRHETVLEAF